jgi:ketol-acid reductoisomerase
MKSPPDGYETIPADVTPLRNRKIGIIGFGNQAQPWALNLFDSGLEVYVGLRTGSKKALRAIESLIEVIPPERIAMMCDIICPLIPDELIPEVLRDDIFPNAGDGSTIVLAHSYALLTDRVKFPPKVDCILLAPHGPGEAVRQRFKAGSGLPAQWDIIQDYTGDAQATVYALASALGFAAGGLRRVNARDEAIIDLFSEQAVLVGGMLSIIGQALETLKDGGYDPAVSYVSCVNEIKGTAELFAEEGISDGLNKVSSAALYGAYKAIEHLREPLAKVFRDLLADIESGRFTADFERACEDGTPIIDKLKDDFKRVMSP